MSAEGARIAEHGQKYFLNNEKELVLQYSDQWVAIADEEVVEHAESHDELVRKLEKGDLSIDEVFVKYIRDGERTVIR